MRDRTSRLLRSALTAATALLTTAPGRDLAAAGQGWDATQATQGLAVLAGFTVALIVGLALLARAVARLWARPAMSALELKRLLDERADILVVDVRTAEDFIGEQGHIAAATNIPLEALKSRLPLLAADRNRPIALVCRTDRRSAKAAKLLARHGFADVRVVQGGMTAWLDNGWPVEGARPTPG